MVNFFLERTGNEDVLTIFFEKKITRTTGLKKNIVGEYKTLKSAREKAYTMGYKYLVEQAGENFNGNEDFIEEWTTRSTLY